MCCPPGHGCNAPGHDQPCALELCRGAVAEPDAELALARWEALEDAAHQECSGRKIRSMRRAFERSRDRALISLALARADARPAMAQADAHRARTPARFKRRGRSRPVAVA